MKNIHKTKFILIGLIIGLMASSFFAYADEIGQFILTKVNYPIVVNNQEYTNSELPVLNYEGNTYVPLKAVGKLLNTKVKWNDELKRVEIGDNNLSQSTTYEVPQGAIELSVGETYDNENAKITFSEIKEIAVDEAMHNHRPDLTEQFDYVIKIQLDENIAIEKTLCSGYYITDNQEYNNPKKISPIIMQAPIDYGEEMTFSIRYWNKTDYTVKKAILSFPELDIENLIFKVVD